MTPTSPASPSGRLTPSQRPGQGRIARPPPAEKRESLLRASILDTALELGVGTSNTVANWIFNPVTEGDEDTEDTQSPSLTYGSTATSEDSFSPARLGSAKSPTGNYLGSTQKDGTFPHQRTVQFDLSPSPVPESIAEQPSPQGKQWHRKLRKSKPKGDGNGDESDGGYMSESGKSEKEGKKKKKTKEKDKKGNGTDHEDESDGGYFSDILNKRRGKKAKAAAAATRAAKLADANANSPSTNYDTDGGPPSVPISRNKKDKKSKSSPGAGDESDGGNLSESSTKKKRFFRLRRRAESDASGGQREFVPPVPALPTLPPMPPMPLPIADRFFRSDTPLGSILTVDSSSSVPYSTYTSASAAASVVTLRTETPADRDDASFLDTNTISSSNSSGALGSPLDSPRGLTHAFRDAESIRTPSTDVLRAFGRQVGLSALASPSPNGNQSLSSSQSQSLAQMQMQMKTVVGATDTPTPTHARDDSQHTTASVSIADPRVSLYTLHGVPTLDAQLPRPKRNLSVKRTPAPTQMKISAPNTRALSAKPHPPPLTFTPPSPHSNGDGASGATREDNMGFDLTPRSPNPKTGSVAFSVIARPTTPTGSVYESLPQSPSGTFVSDTAGTSPLPSPQKANFYAHSASDSQTSLSRPHQHFAKYDLPPPSPPPMGPLPRVPSNSVQFPSEVQAAEPRMLPNKSSLRSLKVSTVSRSGTGDSGQRPLPSPSPLSKSSSESAVTRPSTAPLTSQTFRAPPLKLATSTPPTSAPPTIRWGSGPSSASASSSGSTTPLFLQRVPSIQRGREAPFPTKPVLFHTESDIFVSGRMPSSTASSPNPRAETHMQVEPGLGPFSADANRPGNRSGVRQLNVHWEPRSASAADYRQDPDEDQPEDENMDDEGRHSWVDFGSAPGHKRGEPSGSGSDRSSTSSHPDIESVLSALQDDDDELYADHSGDDDDRSHYADEEVRTTQYFDADGDSDTEGHERYSMWSEADGGDRRSHASVLDAKRSGDVRDKLARRVEQMYSREGIALGLVPPVPTLPLPKPRGMQR